MAHGVKPAPASKLAESADEADTEHIFGFTEGSDIGKKGEIEAESQTDGGLGKRAGTYTALGNVSMLKYSVADDLRIAPWVASTYHNISGVPGFDDRSGPAFQGLGVEMRYRLLDREKAPFGLTLNVSPHWNRIDEATGEGVRQYGVGFAALLDKEIVADRIWGAFNLFYEPEWTRLGTGEWERDATIGLGAAVTHRVRPWLFLGGELRYMRKYEGAGLGTFAGEALYVGPTAYVIMSPRWNVTLAWNIQVAGHAVGDPGPLDLVNFERHQVHIRLGYSF
jgi:hypothetical protein